MIRLVLISVFAAAIATAQWKESSEAEQNDLRRALGEAGSSPVEFVHALEKHLQKYPASPQRPQIERALVKAAMEARDDNRTLKYGEKVIARGDEDPQVLERVSRILLKSDDAQNAERALKYARKFEEIMRSLEKEGPSEARNKGQMTDELDRAVGRAMVLQARAIGNLGKTDEAIALANKSYARYPTAESAREIARWLARAGREMEAVERYADAFTLDDSRNTASERARDRAKMGELYRKLKNTDEGLGDLVLKAYDRTSELMTRRAALQRQQDPNAAATDVLEFTLAGLKGDKLPLASLKGKVVVMDFWATWCGPCRVQHPLYEKVKEKFAADPSVVFLSVNTDEDQAAVPGFIQAQKWSDKVYFEGGLSEFLRVSSIPTTIILDKEGRVVNRLNGFLPERFVEMLTERITDALANTRAQG
jgi:thiol-disulfide isomerase/thioredoxin